jgi:uncharacterized protein
MIDYQNYLYLILLISLLQTISGVGILLLGTPLLLFHNYEMTEVLRFLLPISITVSFLNLIYFQFTIQNFKKKITPGLKSSFFYFCIPGIFLGLFFLMLFENDINLKLIVAILILLSLLIKYNFKELILKIDDNFKKIILSIIGFLHGLSNAGGSLLSIFLLIEFKNNKLQSRYSITYFYFFLALIQYFIFMLLFKKYFEVDHIIPLIPYIIFSIILGNIFIKKIGSSIFQKIVEFLSLISALILIFNILL